MEMSPTERRKGGQSSHDGQNFLPELESVEWSEEGSECGKTDRFVKVELVCSIEGGEGELPSQDGTRTESELCQVGSVWLSIYIQGEEENLQHCPAWKRLKRWMNRID